VVNLKHDSNNKKEILKKLNVLKKSRELLTQKITILRKLNYVMCNSPKKLKPEYAFETQEDYYKVLVEKWSNDVELQALNLLENIRQLDVQIDFYEKELKKSEEEAAQDLEKKAQEERVEQQTSKPTLTVKKAKKAKKGKK